MKRSLKLKVGGLYQDCSYHPVLCTHLNEGEDIIEGISLIDGSTPRACSLHNCVPEAITLEQALQLKEHGPTEEQKTHWHRMSEAGWIKEPWWDTSNDEYLKTKKEIQSGGNA